MPPSAHDAKAADTAPDPPPQPQADGDSRPPSEPAEDRDAKTIASTTTGDRGGVS